MPDVTGVHIPRALNNLSLYYRNPSYIADVFSPPVPVVKEADKYFVYGKENFRLGSSRRADKARTREIEYSLSTDTYYCDEYGYHELISDRERDNSDEPLRPDYDTTEHITECLLLDREYRFAQAVLDNTNTEWGAFASSHFVNLAEAWSDPASADPRTDIYNGKRFVFRDSRRQANMMAVPTDVAFQMSLIESLDELRKYTDAGLLTNSGLPSNLFGLRVSEAQSTFDAAFDGADEDFEETWGNNVLICYVNPQKTGLKTLTFSLTMQKRPMQVKKWREEPRSSDIIEITHIEDRKIIAPACGFVLLNCTNSDIA